MKCKTRIERLAILLITVGLVVMIFAHFHLNQINNNADPALNEYAPAADDLRLIKPVDSLVKSRAPAKPLAKAEQYIDGGPVIEFLKKFAPQYDGRVASCQYRVKDANLIMTTHTDERMTIEMCERKCYEAETKFAALSLGTRCDCLHFYGSERMDKYSECNMACGGDLQSYCGSKTHAFTFKIDLGRLKEVVEDFVWYSPWTTFKTQLSDATSNVRRRFSGCDSIDFKTKTECEAKIQTHPDVLEESLDGPGSQFIGCFTDLSFDEDSIFKISFKHDPDVTDSVAAARCLMKCEHESDYAIVLKKGCFCSNSLGLAQPVDTCLDMLGAAIFSTEKFSDTIRLKFEKEVDKTKVSILAHYRGGSTFVLEMFNSYPHSLSIYEPDTLLGKVWPEVATYRMEEERAHIYLHQILPAWLDCHQDVMPGYFSQIFPVVAERQSGMRDVYRYCKSVLKGIKQNYCLIFLKEVCLKAPVVVMKSVRILAPIAVERAVKSRPDVQFLYTVRDPRAQLASRIAMSAWWNKDPVARLDDLCAEIINMEPIFQENKYNNSQIAFYERTVLDVVESARTIYGAIGLELPNKVVDRLEYISGKSGEISDRDDVDVFNIVRRNSTSHINKWAKMKEGSPFLMNVNEADRTESCSKLYEIFQDFYLPFTLMQV